MKIDTPAPKSQGLHGKSPSFGVLNTGKTGTVDPDVFVSNLELEDNNDFLLETGGFILLE